VIGLAAQTPTRGLSAREYIGNCGVLNSATAAGVAARAGRSDLAMASSTDCSVTARHRLASPDTRQRKESIEASACTCGRARE
jgi:hypothetical protein